MLLWNSSFLERMEEDDTKEDARFGVFHDAGTSVLL
jgi:hypothetical protein